MLQRQSINIFLADDDEDDQFLFNEALETSKLDFSLKSFLNGQELLSYLEKSVIIPDLLFMDINMPIMNGKECLKKIRAKRQFNNIPIIMYSTSTSEHDIEEAFKLGANLYMPKPNSISIQVGMIDKLLELFDSGELMTTQIENFIFQYIT